MDRERRRVTCGEHEQHGAERGQQCRSTARRPRVRHAGRVREAMAGRAEEEVEGVGASAAMRNAIRTGTTFSS